jgi:hypothetical protein
MYSPFWPQKFLTCVESFRRGRFSPRGRHGVLLSYERRMTLSWGDQHGLNDRADEVTFVSQRAEAAHTPAAFVRRQRRRERMLAAGRRLGQNEMALFPAVIPRMITASSLENCPCVLMIPASRKN